MTRKRFTLWGFWSILALGYFGGDYIAGWPMAVTGLIWSFVSVFAGMLFGKLDTQPVIMRLEGEIREARNDYAELSSKIRIEKQEAENVLEEAQVVNEGTVRAVTDRVANRIMSKFVPELSNDVRRKMVFKEVESIVTEEMSRSGVAEKTIEPQKV